MSAEYCYWSVATGDDGVLMEYCVKTARSAGVFKEFHVLADRELEDCECYDAYECDKTGGLFKLHYLKIGISRLPFDYFIWLDPRTHFVRSPINILGVLGRSPLHVPLEFSLGGLKQDAVYNGISCFKLRQIYLEMGIQTGTYLCQSAFWIVRREAIDAVYELAFQFINLVKTNNVTLNVETALAYAMQLLCANPHAHLISKHANIWATDNLASFKRDAPRPAPWLWQHPLGGQSFEVNPAIVHLPLKAIIHSP